ncbi:ATP-binding protein [Mycobacteroides salmoniphilum]|uniref:BbrUII/HgiDII family restriction enzyme n=1 Tax=Mycobacteroides salmoniphilum TaxID=404941 RepID=UPI0010AAC366|nr:ATP-binding protein [Mycobacteroides salmoniphilum]QCH22640.1 DNA mismatch repair protein MutL [Mycobacteroides salmoniphilum]
MSETPQDGSNTYEMKISMSVFEALGINLYSNAAAVLAELVANGWDADANLVQVSWQTEGEEPCVEIRDDGHGMSREDLNDKFLTVGYPKRANEGDRSYQYKRLYMGRKGIGKLSVFSIADTVEVYSAKGGSQNAFKIEVEDLKEKIEKDEKYSPKEIPPIDSLKGHGTVIRLTNLRRKRIDITLNAVRKRIARRFDVLTLTPPPLESEPVDVDAVNEYLNQLRKSDKKNQLPRTFYVAMNGDLITFDDRVELKKLEFLWEFGEQKIPATSLADDVQRRVIRGDVSDTESWQLTGWFGTTKRPSQLVEDSDAGSVGNIMVLARGRPIQEGIIDRLDFNRMFVSYVTGQIRGDFLDTAENDDIATSDRQRLMEDDPRVLALGKFLREVLLKTSDEWSKLRPKKKAKEILANNAPIRGWIESLPKYQRDSAAQLMGTIESLSIPESTDQQEDRNRLFKSGIIAFQRIALREDLAELEQLSTLHSENILHALATLDDYESAMYLDLIRARVETVQSFKNDVGINVLEKTLQDKLHQNLWLLDPAWDRIQQDVEMEERVFEMAEKFGAARPDEDALKRIDLRYCNVQNRHVIIELKRPHIKPDVDDLYDQGLMYVSALSKILEETGRSDEPYELIFIVGEKPTTKKVPPAKLSDDYSRTRLAEISGRVFRYQELIHKAEAQYNDYIQKNKDLNSLTQVLNSLDGP